MDCAHPLESPGAVFEGARHVGDRLTASQGPEDGLLVCQIGVHAFDVQALQGSPG